MTQQQTTIHGASVAVFCAAGVLIVKRARPPLAGLWSLPGGHIRDGETPQQAAIREVHEETGLEIDVVGKLGRHHVCNSADDGSERTFVIEVFYALHGANRTPQAADDAAAARFVALAELNRYALTEGASRFILRAAQLLDTEGSLPCAKP